MIAGQLSTLGESQVGRKMLGYNLGLSKALVTGATDKFPGPLLNTMGAGRAKGGLKGRILRFNRFGDMSDDNLKQLLKDVFSIERDSIAAELFLGDKPEIFETLENHAAKLDELFDAGQDAVLDLVVDRDTRKEYGDQVEELVDFVVTTKEQLIDVGADVLPDGTDGANTCE